MRTLAIIGFQSAMWLGGMFLVLWALFSGQWLGALLLIPVWLTADILIAKRTGLIG